MSLAKTAQKTPFNDLLGIDSNDASDTEYDLSVSDEDVAEPAVAIVVDDATDHEAVAEQIAEVVEDLVDQDGDDIIEFTLPHLPGSVLSLEDEENEVSIDESEEDKDVEIKELNRWDWKGHGLVNFPTWLENMTKNCPRHSGKDTVGLERCISWFEELNSVIPKAVRADKDSEISDLDMRKIEKIRDEIHDAIGRLRERLEKVESNKYKKKGKKDKKASDDQATMIKNAQKITGVEGIFVSVPLLIYGIVTTCINGAVSGGHDIEDMFTKLAKKFKLSEREQYEAVQLLENMGWPVRRDGGFLVGEDTTGASEDKFDWPAQYNA